VTGDADKGGAFVTANESADNVGAFLAVFAALLLDNVLRLEETVGRVTDLIMSSGRPDREMVVTLQSFDRLKQEFEALGDALTRYAEFTNAIPSAGEERIQLGQEVISAITVADLKDRLLYRLKDQLPALANMPKIMDIGDTQIDIDVVY
jgi:hypothetical protein